MKIGERIKYLREKNKMTQEELAKILKTTKQNIYKYENGIVTNIPSDKIEIMSQKFGCSPAYIMGWESEPISSYENNSTTNNSYEIENPDIIMIARAGKKMTPEQALKLRNYAEKTFPEAFTKGDD